MNTNKVNRILKEMRNRDPIKVKRAALKLKSKLNGNISKEASMLIKSSGMGEHNMLITGESLRDTIEFTQK